MWPLFPGLTPLSGSYEENLRASLRAAKTDTRLASLARQVHEMVAALDGLTLLSASLWELLKERTHLTDEELRQKVQAVDLRDGRLDGKLAPYPDRCGDCERPSNGRRSRCIYCGMEFSPQSPLW